MESLPVVQRHPSLRWLVPSGVLALLVLAAVNALQPARDAGPSLPTLSPDTLIAQVRAATLPAFAATAVAQVSTGSDALVEVAPAAAPSTSLAGMSAGTHTLRVWYSGASHQRVALVGPLSENDVFRSGADVWQWSSADRVAVHSRVSAASAGDEGLWTSAVTPVDLAARLVAAARTDTSVSIAGAEEVAGRAAYALVLRPTARDTLVDYAHIAVDGATKTPLAVQIYPRGNTEPAIDVAFTNIRFDAQPASTFQFRPPVGATVRAAQVRAVPRTIGHGWTAVLCYRGKPHPLASLELTAVAPVIVKGHWGKGRLITLPLVSTLVTQDGRTFVGPVTPAALYAAAAHRK